MVERGRQGRLPFAAAEDDLMTARKGTVLATKAVETQGKGGVLEREGSGDTRQMRFLTGEVATNSSASITCSHESAPRNSQM